MLRNKADIKSILWMFFTTALFIFLWIKGFELFATTTWLFVICYVALLYFSVTVAVMAHNHNHLSMWKNKTMNILTENWLTIFYGFPVFAWIPTHNSNHHLYVNKEPDYTRTYRLTEKNNLFTVLTYPSISGFFQQSKVFSYLSETFKRNRKKGMFYVLQFVCLVTWIAAFLILDWQKALVFVIIPQQFSLFSVLLFNYVQHIHADEESKYNSSRNFVGAINFFLFNNGLHTAHHLYPKIHWSALKAEHAKLEHLIDDSLVESSFWGYLFKSYILGIFVPKFRTKNMRMQRIQQNIQRA